VTFSWTIFAVTVAFALLFLVAYLAWKTGPGDDE
jgi:hypothetical protein